MKWIDIVDKNISIYIINIGAVTPLPSFKEESDGGGGVLLRKSLNCGMGINFHMATLPLCLKATPTFFDPSKHQFN